MNDRERRKLLKEIKERSAEEIAELDEKRELCGNCDAGLPMNCTCPKDPAWNEMQPIIDRLEGASDPFGDFAQGDDEEGAYG